VRAWFGQPFASRRISIAAVTYVSGRKRNRDACRSAAGHRDSHTRRNRSSASYSLRVVCACRASYTAIYSFGDSLSDVGNGHTLTTILTLGKTPEPSAPYVNGQFSNGSV
jgi:hypothetical protein